LESIAKTLLDSVGISSQVRPISVEKVLTSLLVTIQRHKLMQEALQDLELYAKMPHTGEISISAIEEIASVPELAFLKVDSHIALFLRLLPDIMAADTYAASTLTDEELTNIVGKETKKRHTKTKVSQALDAINSLAIGYKVIQEYGKDYTEFHILKFETKEELMSILKMHNLYTKYIIDKVTR